MGTLVFLKMLCLTKGRGTVWYTAAALALGLTDHGLGERLRSTFFVARKGRSFVKAMRRPRFPFQVLGKRAAKTLDMAQYVIGFLNDLPGDEREDSRNIGALLLRPLHPTPKKRILFLFHDNADKWQ